MMNNSPLTFQEYILSENEAIVSKTDLKGNITYVNEDFIRISGFSEDELIGSPQNIVRHPDMPREVFKDMWATLHRGKAWTGIVKNRCKNGTFYWVEATAAPILQDRKVIGYTSIRIKANRKSIEVAERIYYDFRNNKSKFSIDEGIFFRPKQKVFNFFKKIPYRDKKIYFSLLILAFLYISFFSKNIYFQRTGIFATTLLIVLNFVDTYISVIYPLSTIKIILEKMASGNLSENINPSGTLEIKNLLQTIKVFQTNIRLIVGQIKQSTITVSSNTAILKTGNIELASRTESQASFLEETAASMEELTSTVRSNADNSSEANQIVRIASNAAHHGSETFEIFMNLMAQIKASSNKIENIISVIDGIAFQTNILALNAAVEAARAGEQGRGFAVVASEVRLLAHRSSSAAKEVKALIDESIIHINNGNKVANDAEMAMRKIKDAVSQAAEIINEISQASYEQSSGISQVSIAISEMENVTLQNSAMVDEAAICANGLYQQVGVLNSLVDNFSLVKQNHIC